MLGKKRSGTRRTPKVRRDLADFLTDYQKDQWKTKRVIPFRGSDGGYYRIVCNQGTTYNVQVRSAHGVIRKATKTGKPHACECGCGRIVTEYGIPKAVIPYGTMLCAVPRSFTGPHECWLQQILLIQADEQAFLKKANIGTMLT